MLDAVSSEQSISDQPNFSSNESFVINSQYYDSWANSFISLISESLKKYQIDNPEKSLVRYLKLRITDEDGNLMPLNNLAIQDDTYSLPDEPVSFNDDGALTIDFTSPARVAGLDADGVLNIDPSFPYYNKIISMTKDLERISDFLLEVACFNGDCSDVGEELISRAKEYAEDNLEDYELADYINNIDGDHSKQFVTNNYRTTPEKIAYLAYARKTSLETYNVDLSDLCMEKGSSSERSMLAQIGKELELLESDPKRDVIGEIDTFLYDKFQKLLDGDCLYEPGM